MDKTVSISLGGFSFILEESAYNKLKKYLHDVKNSLQGTEGIEDIIEDVEIRIAELFKDKLKFREVINDDDVYYVIATMGHPEQYKVNEDEDQLNNYTNNNYNNDEFVKTKKLFKDPDDKIISGLSSGIAHYFGLDPWAIRAAWLIFGFLGLFTQGVSLLFVLLCYFVLFLLIPKAKTTSEKLQMYGKPANIEGLKKNFENASESINSNSKEISNKIGGFFSILGKLILFFLGFILFCIAIALIISGIAISFTSWLNIPTEIYGYLIEEKWMGITAKILASFTLIIPGIILLILALKCFTRFEVKRSLIIGSICTWFIALFFLIIIGGYTASKFKTSVENTKEIVVNTTKDTLNISFSENFGTNYKYNNSINDLSNLLDNNGNLIIPKNRKITLKPSSNNQYKFEVNYFSKGGDPINAKENLDAINYNFSVQDNSVLFDQYFLLKKDNKFRNQKVGLTIYIPNNKYVKINNTKKLVIHNRNNKDITKNIDNQLYINNGKNIVCLDCKTDDTITIDETTDDYEDLIEINKEFKSIEIKEGDSTKVIIDKNGIRIKDKKHSVGINLGEDSNK